MLVCGYGWVGAGGGGDSTDVRTEWPPFSALPGIWLVPFLQQKVYDWPDLFIRMWKAPLFWHPGKCVYFFRSEIC